jgi:hypothetical protein
MRSLLAACFGTAFCCACAGNPPGPEQLRAQRLAKLDDITRICRLPPSIFKLVGFEELHIQPSPDEDYERLDCALSELKKSGIPLKIGFVGNEAYETGNQN